VKMHLEADSTHALQGAFFVAKNEVIATEF